jgi:hypothetical protein
MGRGFAVGVLSVVACSSGSGAPAPICESSSPITSNEIQAICQKVVALGCPAGPSHAACVADVGSFTSEYDSGCCGAKAAALLRCGAKNGFRCADTSDDVLFAPACASTEEAFDQCAGSHDNCTESIGQNETTLECDQYAASCQAGACTCTFGPHVGTKFTLSGGTYEDDVVEVAAACK